MASPSKIVIIATVSLFGYVGAAGLMGLQTTAEELPIQDQGSDRRKQIDMAFAQDGENKGAVSTDTESTASADATSDTLLHGPIEESSASPSETPTGQDEALTTTRDSGSGDHREAAAATLVQKGGSLAPERAALTDKFLGLSETLPAAAGSSDIKQAAEIIARVGDKENSMMQSGELLAQHDSSEEYASADVALGMPLDDQKATRPEQSNRVWLTGYGTILALAGLAVLVGRQCVSGVLRLWESKGLAELRSEPQDGYAIMATVSGKPYLSV